MDTQNTQIKQFFIDNKQFKWIVKTSNNSQSSCDSLVSFFNPLQASCIQILGPAELEYFNSLAVLNQIVAVQKLAAQGVQYLVVSDAQSVPDALLRQKHISVLSTNLAANSMIRLLNNRFPGAHRHSEIVQGALLVIENQGLLLMGKSGAGKSQLLLSLLARGHQWVSDELTHCFVDPTGNVVGKAVGDLASFAHVKHLGPVNIDQIFGLSKRLPSHTLAGVIYLSENSDSANHRIPTYSQKVEQVILDQQFPMWYIDPSNNNVEVLIETCAKQLILQQWGEQAEYQLAQELQETLTETT